MSPYSIPGIRVAGATTFTDIEEVVCGFYGQPLDKVYSKSRSRELVWCRHLIAFFALEFLNLGLVAIGDHMGVHHTTVIHSRQNVYNRKHTEQLFSAEVEEIRKRIRERKFSA